MFRYSGLILLLAFGGCAHRQRSRLPYPAECPPTSPQSAIPYDTAQWRAVAGRFRLILVDTVNGRSWNPEDTHIELQVVDSAFLAEWNAREEAARRFYRRAEAAPTPQLVGVERSSGKPRINPNLVFYLGTLVDGCERHCFDASPTYYGFRLQTSNGYRGDWLNNMTGIVFLVDPKTKRRLPPPAGYFCAIREP